MDLSPHTPNRQSLDIDATVLAKWLPPLRNLELWARTDPFRAEDLVIDPMWDAAPPDVFEAAWCTLLTMNYPNDYLINTLLNTTRVNDPRTGVPLNRGARLAINNGPTLWPLIIAAHRSSSPDPIHNNRWCFQSAITESVFNAIYAAEPMRPQSSVPAWLRLIGAADRIPLDALEAELMNDQWGQHLLNRVPDWSDPDLHVNQRMFGAALMVLAADMQQQELLAATRPSMDVTSGYPLHLSLQYGTLQGLEALCQTITPEQVAAAWSNWSDVAVKDPPSLDRLLHHVPHLDTDVVQAALAYRFLETIDRPEACMAMWPHTSAARLQASMDEQWGSPHPFDTDILAVIEMCQTKKVLEDNVSPTALKSASKRM